MRPLANDAEVEEMLDRETAVLFKHSPICGTSARARRQVERFVARNPDTPVYVLDVLEARDLSRRVAERFGIRHESPQAIVLRRGAPIWTGSHFRITARALQREVRRPS
ncbi:MAG: bacillithiol system redox-active protein YtxJ [Gemmatimonadota bacterium]